MRLVLTRQVAPADSFPELDFNRRLHMHPLTLQMHNDSTWLWRGEVKSADNLVRSSMLQQTCAWHHGLIQELVCAHSSRIRCLCAKMGKRLYSQLCNFCRKLRA